MHGAGRTRTLPNGGAGRWALRSVPVERLYNEAQRSTVDDALIWLFLPFELFDLCRMHRGKSRNRCSPCTGCAPARGRRCCRRRTLCSGCALPRPCLHLFAPPMSLSAPVLSYGAGYRLDPARHDTNDAPKLPHSWMELVPFVSKKLPYATTL